MKVRLWILALGMVGSLYGATWSKPSQSNPREHAILVSFWNSSHDEIGGAGADSSAELGMKFTSDVAGQLIGLRFYKFPRNTGVHLGSVWSSTGDLLASTTFKDETFSGWQEAQFASPIPIHENTVYIISYHAPSGHYAFTKGFFVQPISAEMLHAPAGAGVFVYSQTSRFPTRSFGNANYWVDPIVLAKPAPRYPRTVTLHWKASITPVVFYNVYRKTSQMQHYICIASGLKGITYDDHVVAVKGETYYYAVTAVDGNHRESGYSNEAQIITP